MGRAPVVILALSAAAALACARPTPNPKDSDLGSQIAGIWSARLVVDRPPIFVRDDSAAARALTGRFAFVGASPALRATGAAAFGVYDIDFGAMNLPQRRGVPSAALYARNHDSVEIRLDPIDAETFVVLRGRMAGDSILGAWNISVPRVTEGGGTFVLVRQHDR